MSDADIFFGIFLAILLSVIVRRRLWQVLLRLVAVFSGLLYVADIGIYTQFDTRLYFEDVTRFGVALEPVISQALTTAGSGWEWYMAGLVVLVIIGFTFISRTAGTASKWMLTIATLVFFMLSQVPIKTTYIHSWAYKNFIDVNLGNTQTAKYTNDYIEKLNSSYTRPAAVCFNGLGQKPDIILVVVESLSNYQSKLLSGFNDLLPNLDKLATRNTYYSQFIANHFATNPGLAHLLTGSTIIAPADGGRIAHPFETAWDHNNTLPDFLADHGYFSAFLTSGDLDFAMMREWLQHIGFDHVEGSDFEGYTGQQRTAFNAIPDQVLLDRSLAFIHELGAQNKPFFLTVNTMSTHQPYIHPETLERSLEKTFRYSDEQIFLFYNALEKAGFFNNGILLITSDHRSMTPIQAEEFEAYDLLAPALIPMIVVAPRFAPARGEVATPLQQSDVLNSVMYLVSDRYCTAPGKRNLFKPEDSVRTLLHRRGDLRDRLNVFYATGRGVVHLNGDDTGFSRSVDIPKRRQGQIIEFINHERIKSDQRQREAIVKGLVPYK